ncbi:MAG: hypothetical protein ABJO57_16115 [Lentilitoribacter sp.]
MAAAKRYCCIPFARNHTTLQSARTIADDEINRLHNTTTLASGRIVAVQFVTTPPTLFAVLTNIYVCGYSSKANQGLESFFAPITI